MVVLWVLVIELGDRLSNGEDITVQSIVTHYGCHNNFLYETERFEKAQYKIKLHEQKLWFQIV